MKNQKIVIKKIYFFFFTDFIKIYFTFINIKFFPFKIYSLLHSKLQNVIDFTLFFH